MGNTEAKILNEIVFNSTDIPSPPGALDNFKNIGDIDDDKFHVIGRFGAETPGTIDNEFYMYPLTDTNGVYVVRRKLKTGDPSRCCLENIKSYWDDKLNIRTCDNKYSDVKCVECQDVFLKYIDYDTKSFELLPCMERVLDWISVAKDKRLDNKLFEICKDNIDTDIRCKYWMINLRKNNNDDYYQNLADAVILNQKDKSNFKCAYPLINNLYNGYECDYSPCNTEPIYKLLSRNIKNKSMCVYQNRDINIKEINIDNNTKLTISDESVPANNYDNNNTNYKNMKIEKKNTRFPLFNNVFVVILIIIVTIYIIITIYNNKLINHAYINNYHK